MAIIGLKPSKHLFLFSLGASLIIWAVYGQLLGHSFINFDDTIYISQNKNVQSGLTVSGLSWAFTTPYASNWHPLTWLSHMLDCQLFGLNAGWHHLGNILFHLANTILLFAFLNGTTKKFWPSSFVSLLFALHPLHVESVAWAAERKDVLSSFFLLLALITYSTYTRRPGLKNYLIFALFFVLGLLSKPMLVTLPFLLLLLDYWPLCRLRATENKQLPLLALVYEKLPLFIFSGLSCLITIIVQSQSGAIKSLQMIPLQSRLANALVTYVMYLKKTVWPTNLTILYPYPKSIPLPLVIGAIVTLLLISLVAFRYRRKKPFLLVGWLWYVGTLLPVIGIVQVGVQSMADRYTYVPLIGIFIMVSFAAAEWAGGSDTKRLRREKLCLFCGTIILLSLTNITWQQAKKWQNSTTLFQYTLAVSDDNYTAHNYLAQALATDGKFKEAENHYQEALKIQANYSEALVNLGILLAEQGRLEQAKIYLEKAAINDPLNPKILNNLGNIYKSKGELQRSTTYYRKAISENPNYEEALFNLANTLEKQNKFQESISLYTKAIEINPEFAAAYNGLGVSWAREGNMERAVMYFKKALKLRPGYSQAMKNLELANRQTGK